MFWNDLKEIKDWMNRLTERLCRIDENINRITMKGGRLDAIETRLSQEVVIKGAADIETNIDRLNAVLQIAESDFDKIDRYIANLDKYNGMINELKGCVSLARGAVMDRKHADSEQSDRIHQVIYHVETMLKDNCQIMDVLRKNIKQFADFLHKCEKKSCKPRKSVKKKTTSQASLSQ